MSCRLGGWQNMLDFFHAWFLKRSRGISHMYIAVVASVQAYS